MGHRLVEIAVPVAHAPGLREAVEEAAALGSWIEAAEDWEHIHARLLVDETDTEAVLNAISDRFEGVEGFRIVLLSVEATVPKPEPPGEDDQSGADPDGAASEEKTSRISVHELQADVVDMCKLDSNFFAMVVIASVVAAIGLILDNVAIIIGSMVIAPLIGPSVALSLASTLGDGGMARQALKSNVAGLLSALVLPLAIGLIYPVDPSIGQIEIRTGATLWDVGLGLAVGSAGVLAVTTGVSTALVGVMVAVALVPPLVAVGLLLGSGHVALALGAAELLATYVIAINLAGVVTFVARGVRPYRYWEEAKARRATVMAVVVWVVLLAALAASILVFP